MPKTPLPPVETVVFRGEEVMDEVPVEPYSAEGKLAGAKELFRQGNYATAERVFHRLFENKKNAQPLLEEARFMEAECLRLQGYYPKAADTYVDLLKKFDRTPYKDAAIQHMFDIANYWLDDSREEMKETGNFAMEAGFCGAEVRVLRTNETLYGQGRASYRKTRASALE